MLLNTKNETLCSGSESATATAYERLTVTNSDAGLYISLSSSVNIDFSEDTHKTTEIHTDAVVSIALTAIAFIVALYYVKKLDKLESLFTVMSDSVRRHFMYFAAKCLWHTAIAITGFSFLSCTL